MSGRFTIKKRITIVEAPKVERSAFPRFEKKKVTVEAEEEEVANLVTRLMELGSACYMGFILMSRDDLRTRTWGPIVYTRETSGEAFKGFVEHRYYDLLSGFLFRNIIKAAAQIASNIVFSNDGGKVYTAMEGFGKLDGQYWTVDKIHTGRTVVPIDSVQAVDLQLFCASVGLGRTQSVENVGGSMQTISKPTIIPKNRVERVRLEFTLKKIFSGLLYMAGMEPNGEGAYTDDQIKRAPWIWKAVHTIAAGTKVPVTGLSLPLIYFTYVSASFDYNPFPINLNELFYVNYDYIMKELVDQVAKYSVYKGGYFVNKYSYFNEGLKQSWVKVVGGGFPVKWCAYNTVPGVTWEREGAFMEGGDLGTKIATTRPAEEFDGLFYDPAQCASRIYNAKGVIVPYGRDGAGIVAVEEWITVRARHLKIKPSDMQFQIFATYGSAPMLWVVHLPVTTGLTLTRWLRPPVEALWKVMGTMPLFNLCASLNIQAARAEAYAINKPDHWPEILAEWGEAEIPTLPVMLSAFDPKCEMYWNTPTPKGTVRRKVPAFRHTYMGHDYLPGRHRVDNNRKKTASAFADAWDGYEEFASDQASDHRPAPPPSNKRKKVEEPLTHVGMSNPFDEHLPTDPISDGAFSSVEADDEDENLEEEDEAEESQDTAEDMQDNDEQ